MAEHDDSSDVEIVGEFHSALGHHDFDRIASLLAPDVVWRAAPPQEDVCGNRDEVMTRLREVAGQVPPLDSLELLEIEDGLLVGIPTHEPWDHAEFYQRVRLRNGVITAIQDFDSREAALTG